MNVNKGFIKIIMVPVLVAIVNFQIAQNVLLTTVASAIMDLFWI